jgi:glycosyltransferase involved in cell wall biosynthesis
MQLDQEFEDKKIVLAVSSVWTHLKGYDDLKVINLLLDKDKYKLVVIGVNSRQQEDLSQEGIFSIKRTESAIKLAMWYDKAFAFINPTYEDTFPTVNIEAIASGTPVITYRTGGSPELVFDGCGAIVNVGDCGGIVRALEVLEKNAGLCREHGEEFNQSKVYSKYVDLLESIVGSTNKKTI